MKKHLLFFASALISIQMLSQNAEENFKTVCASCHTIGKGLLVGPDLKGAYKKHKEKWLVKWIKSSQTLVNGGDKTAVELFNQYNQIPMPDNPQFSDADIKAIIAYIKKEGGDSDEPAAGVSNLKETKSGEKAESKPAEVSTEKNISDEKVTENPIKKIIVSSEQQTQTNTATETKIQNTSESSAHIFVYAGIGLGIIFFMALFLLSKSIRTLSHELKNKY